MKRGTLRAFLAAVMAVKGLAQHTIFASLSRVSLSVDLDHVCAAEGHDSDHPLLGPSHSYAALVCNARHPDLQQVLQGQGNIQTLDGRIVAPIASSSWFSSPLWNQTVPAPHLNEPLGVDDLFWSLCNDDSATSELPPNSRWTCGSLTEGFVSSSFCASGQRTLCIVDPAVGGIASSTPRSMYIFPSSIQVPADGDFDGQCTTDAVASNKPWFGASRTFSALLSTPSHPSIPGFFPGSEYLIRDANGRILKQGGFVQARLLYSNLPDANGELVCDGPCTKGMATMDYFWSGVTSDQQTTNGGFDCEDWTITSSTKSVGLGSLSSGFYHKLGKCDQANWLLCLRDPDPTAAPTSPTSVPTEQPTSPTSRPTDVPTAVPTAAPSRLPTSAPTSKPTNNPTAPTTNPTNNPTGAPTTAPTAAPTTVPTAAPTSAPTTIPTISPTSTPTTSPTTTPTNSPTAIPTTAPSTTPTISPSKNPTLVPTWNPTSAEYRLSAVHDTHSKPQLLHQLMILAAPAFHFGLFY